MAHVRCVYREANEEKITRTHRQREPEEIKCIQFERRQRNVFSPNRYVHCVHCSSVDFLIHNYYTSLLFLCISVVDDFAQSQMIASNRHFVSLPPPSRAVPRPLLRLFCY